MAFIAEGFSNPDSQSQAQTYTPMGGVVSGGAPMGGGAGFGGINSETFRKLSHEWFQALTSLGGATVREKLASLPMLKNIVELSGGMNANSKMTMPVKAMGTPIRELEQMAIEQPEKARVLARSVREADAAGAYAPNAHRDFYPSSLGVDSGLPGQEMKELIQITPSEMLRMSGGGVPHPSVWDRAINAAGGMNDPRVQRMLGFGQ